MLRVPGSVNVHDTTWQRLKPQSPKMFFVDTPPTPTPGAERKRSAAPRWPALHPLTSRPPPASHPPPACEPLGRLSAPGRHRVTGAGGWCDAAVRARSSGQGGSSQQLLPLTWKVTAEEEEDGEEEKEEREEEGEENPLVPLFLLSRRPLFAKAERVWWGVSGSISLRTGKRGGGRGGREEIPTASPGFSALYLFFWYCREMMGAGPGPPGSGGSREARGPQY